MMDKQGLIDELNAISDILYKGNTILGISKMNDVIPRIAKFAEEIDEEESRARLISDMLSPILEAMETQDGSMLADVISYELVEFIKEMAK